VAPPRRAAAVAAENNMHAAAAWDDSGLGGLAGLGHAAEADDEGAALLGVSLHGRKRKASAAVREAVEDAAGMHIAQAAAAAGGAGRSSKRPRTATPRGVAHDGGDAMQLVVTFCLAAAAAPGLLVTHQSSAATGTAAKDAKATQRQQQQGMAAMRHTCPAAAKVAEEGVAGAGSSGAAKMSWGMAQGLGIRVQRRQRRCLSPTTLS
jgi:hypothetical protein